MSDLTATNCGCGCNEMSGNNNCCSWIWILLLATAASGAATADAATTAVCGSSCSCSAVAAMAASAAETMDAAANQLSERAGSTEPAFLSPYLLQKHCFVPPFCLPYPQPFSLAPFVPCTPRQARKSLCHL